MPKEITPRPFQVRHILKRNNQNSDRTKLTRGIALTGILLVLFLLGGFYMLVRNVEFSFNFVVDSVVAVFGKEWQQDIQGNTNILLFGIDKEAMLTDSIMVMSINHKQNKVAMISIPRDLYVSYPRGLGQSSRINSIYGYGANTYSEEEGALMLKEKVEEILGVSIPYYVRIDFQGLVDIVDELGGVEIDVPQAIVDTTYPTENYGYQTFRISQGLQTLDGATALKYARSRHTTSDFDRSARQQLILAAIKRKALEKNILSDVDQVRRLFLKFQENVHTNFDINEILTGAKVVRGVDLENMARGVLSDDPTVAGGLLYSPQRSLFNGAAVLLPNGATARSVSYYREVQLFSELLFHHRDMFIDPPRIEILNGTRNPGVAGGLQVRLKRYGFNVVNVGNSQNRDMTETKIYFAPYEHAGTAAALRNLSLFLTGEILQGDETYALKEYDITIVLGSDYKPPSL